MALLTEDFQQKILDTLRAEGLLDAATIDQAKKDAAAANKSVITQLSETGQVDEELLAHVTAQVSGVPYINLSTAMIGQDHRGIIIRRVWMNWRGIWIGTPVRRGWYRNHLSMGTELWAIQ